MHLPLNLRHCRWCLNHVLLLLLYLLRVLLILLPLLLVLMTTPLALMLLMATTLTLLMLSTSLASRSSTSRPARSAFLIATHS